MWCIATLHQREKLRTTLKGPLLVTSQNSTTETSDPIINITGDRVTLGPISRDLVPLYTRWINDFSALRTLGAAQLGPTTIESEESWYESTSKGEHGVLFTIREKSTGRPIGNCGLNHIYPNNRSAIFGIMIGEKDARGKGYGTEAAHLILDYAFTALGLHSVNLTVAGFNLAGQRAYAKAGFKECGRLRETAWFAGKYWDTVLMDCLESEFSGSVLKDIFTADQDKQ
jgi:RimJ/RimL family protein N-acetyltransferase